MVSATAASLLSVDDRVYGLFGMCKLCGYDSLCSLLLTDMESDGHSATLSDDEGQGGGGHYLCSPGRLVG